MFALLIAIIYLSFISLGLPDSLLGSAWPTMYPQFGIPVSFAGIISAIICLGTITSSLLSDRLTKRFGTGLVTAVSVTLTALALLGFSFSSKFWMLILFAIPYGLGAGGVDASLNNYAAVHLKSSHMSWLHCMWGVGAAVSPYIMGFALTKGSGWNQGYFIVSTIQIGLCLILFLTLPVWKKYALTNQVKGAETINSEALTLKQIFSLKGALPCFIAFFGYCAMEQTAMLWSASYLVLHNGISTNAAANYASLFFIGMTVGRAINGFLTMKFSDKFLIRAGSAIVLIGLILMTLPLSSTVTIVALTLIGLGCAPIYPSIIHLTPKLFGADKSQAIIGVQMASAYIGTLTMPPLFGVLADNFGVSLLPYYLLFFLIFMAIMQEITYKKINKTV